MAKQETALVPVEKYRIMTMKPEVVQELVRENLGGGFSPFDLPVITVPTGGATFWTVPSADGPVPVPSVTGIIAYQQMTRLYYAHGLDEPGGQKGPPDCRSYDMEMGVGDPGGSCAVCPFAQFGSARGERRGQACKQYRLLIMVRPESMLPVRLPVPPTSLGNLSTYLMNLTDAGILYNRVVTKLDLEVGEKGGYKTAMIKASKAGELTEEQIERVKPLKDSFRKLFRPEVPEAQPAAKEDGKPAAA